MTTLSLRLPDDLHQRISETAKAKHISVNAALTQAADQWVNGQDRDQLVKTMTDEIFAARKDLFDRLADA